MRLVNGDCPSQTQRELSELGDYVTAELIGALLIGVLVTLPGDRVHFIFRTGNGHKNGVRDLGHRSHGTVDPAAFAVVLQEHHLSSELELEVLISRERIRGKVPAHISRSDLLLTWKLG